jgi:hypothetical protein
MRRKKLQQLPRVEPSPLESTAGIDSLKKLSTEDLKRDLVGATHMESWYETIAASPALDEELKGAMIMSAFHARITREVMALLIVQRDEKKDGPSSPSAYL